MQSPGPDSEGAQVRTLLMVPGPALGLALCTGDTGFWMSPCASGVLLPVSTPVVPLAPVQPLSWWGGDSWDLQGWCPSTRSQHRVTFPLLCPLFRP